jgi:putative tricarboxylic transport membrane protein
VKKAMYGFLVFLVALIILLVAAMQNFPEGKSILGWGPAFYPSFLVFLLIIFTVMEFYKTFKMKEEPSDITIKTLINPAIFLIMMIIYAILLQKLGFVLDGLLYLFILMQILKANLKNSILMSSGVIIFLYLLFHYVFKVPLPPGTLFGG